MDNIECWHLRGENKGLLYTLTSQFQHNASAENVSLARGIKIEREREETWASSGHVRGSLYISPLSLSVLIYTQYGLPSATSFIFMYSLSLVIPRSAMPRPFIHLLYITRESPPPLVFVNYLTYMNFFIKTFWIIKKIHCNLCIEQLHGNKLTSLSFFVIIIAQSATGTNHKLFSNDMPKIFLRVRAADACFLE